MRTFAYAALWGAAMGVAVPGTVAAQDAAMTAGGNVTADQVTPLPPVVVESPSEPLKKQQKTSAVGSGSSAKQTAPAQGEVSGEGVGGSGVGVYTLGQLDMIGGSSITNEAMWTFNKNNLDQALSIVPGVTVTNSGGARNERDILVRGFDRWRVPLYMDGVRIYLPYDNRLDLNRFLTPDLSEVQVEKGYVSVLNGPGGMGGAINLVSRKPTKAFEAEGRVGAVFDGDLDSVGQWNAYAYAGTRQKGYYAQVSGSIVDQDHFSLSNDFDPAGPSTLGYQASFPYEDGGEREHSDFKDWRINAKAGITPNASDEYALSYTYQEGEKDAPLHAGRQAAGFYFFGNPGFGRYWNWPQWDVTSLSWLSKTQLGSSSYVKTNVYYNTLDNMVSFFPNSTYTNQFVDSPYFETSYGGFAEFGTNLIPMNTLKGAIHYRLDQHKEQSINYTYAPTYSAVPDPSTVKEEDNWSFALENTFHASRNLDIVGGVSLDLNDVRRAQFYSNSVFGEYALTNEHAWNGQGAAIYSYSSTGKVHADVSSRARMPTLFERYSTRFDTRANNPNLNPERATNYEIGWSDRILKSVSLSSAVFYSDVKDAILSSSTGANGNNSAIGYNADGEYYGLEISGDWVIANNLRLGGNYTYLHRDFDYAKAAQNLPAGVAANAAAAIKASEVEGTPRHEAFIYLAWQPTRTLTLTPSVELASDRSSLITSCGSTLLRTTDFGQTGCPGSAGAPNSSSPPLPNYAKVGSYALVNLQAEYAFDPKTTMAIGGTNLLDQNYELSEGYPEAGRMFYANLRAKF